MRSLIPFSIFLSIFSTPAYSTIVPFHIQLKHDPTDPLTRRAPTLTPISNTGNAQYVGNVSLGGIEVPVLLDTGSSDLWVNFASGTPAPLKDTGKSLTLSYAVGKASGNVYTTTLEFGGYTVNDQAFLLVTNTSSFTSDIHAQGYDGLLGLGPNDGSVIKKELDDPVGSTMLTNIFEQNKTTDNYISFILDRKNDPGDPFKGQLTISEVIPGFENITSMPKLDVETVNKILEADQHWQALTDKDNGIIGPDGQPIQIKSIVPKAPDGQFVAVFDSGFTFSQVPRDVSDAIYGRVQGAYYDSQNEFWMIPCGQLLNLTFMFGGQPYPVHPLDVVDDNFSRVDATGKKVCIGAFQPITSAFSLLGHYDMILGMSFLRSAYVLLDFGNWIDTNNNNKGSPYIQMASINDVAAARQDFITVRLGGVDTTGDSRWALLPADQMQHSPVSDEEKKKKYQEMVLSRWPYILVGCLIFVILVVGLCIWRCCCRKGKRNGNKKGLFSKKAARTSYHPLEEQSRMGSTISLNQQQYPAQPYPGQQYPSVPPPYEYGNRNYAPQNV